MFKFLKSISFLLLAILIAGAAIWVSFSLTPTTRKTPQISLKKTEASVSTNTSQTTSTQTATSAQPQAIVTQAPVLVETAAPEGVTYYEVVTEQPVETTTAYTTGGQLYFETVPTAEESE